MGIADNLTPKELELANLVDFFNDSFTGTDYKIKLKKGRQLKAIIMDLVLALNAECKSENYFVRYDGCMRLYKNNQAISDREFYDELHRKRIEDVEEKPEFDLEAVCQESVINENRAIDGAFSRLEARGINWAECDISARGHPARNIISMLEMNGCYVMHPEDRAKSKAKILAYGQKIVDLKIITQEYLDNTISVHEAEIEKARIERASKEEL